MFRSTPALFCVLLCQAADAVTHSKSRIARRQHLADANESSLPLVLYGIESCDKPAYNLMVTAQLETWGSELPRNTFVIAGGEHDDAREGVAADEMPCGDSQPELSCKEAALLDRGVRRALQLDAQWLAVGQDDKYIWPKAVAAALAKFDSSKPQVIASFGCGQSWQYHEESQNGTKPLPSGWVEPQYSCDAVWKHGSICGGPVYFVSRGALDILRKPDESEDEFIHKFVEPTRYQGGASDVAASCMFYDRGIPMRIEVDLVSRMLPVPADEIQNGVDSYIEQFKSEHTEVPLTMHLDAAPYLTKDDVPDLIRKLRPIFPGALLQEKTDNAQSSAMDIDQSSDAELEMELGRMKASFLYAIHKYKQWTPSA